MLRTAYKRLVVRCYEYALCRIMTKLRLSKSDAARRQIDAAIRMLFSDEDVVPIHTILMAAFRILRDLTKRKDDSYMERVIEESLIPEGRAKFWSVVHGLSNFLKHADRDPDSVHDGVDETINEPIAFMAILYYLELENKHTPEMLAFHSWFASLHPEFVLSGHNPRLKEMATELGAELKQLSRAEQLEIGRNLVVAARDSIDAQQRNT